MLKTIKALMKIGSAGLIALVFLSWFTIVYCNSGIHVTNSSGATDYKWEPNQLKSTMSEGFAWLHMDKNGFNNSFPPQGDICNLLMGSSHMEAVNVSIDKNVGYLLNELGVGYTYNIGTSGHQIYNCVRNMADAVKEYKPSGYVILETDRVELDINSMKQVLDDTYPHIPSYDSGLLYTVQKYIPSVKHIYNQIDIWKSMESVSAEVRRNTAQYDEYKEVLYAFLKKASDSVGKAKLLIFFHPTTPINSSGSMINETNPDMLEEFARACENNGIMFIDMTESFRELYENEDILPYGFSNTAIGVGHLNENGHAVIATKLSEAIREDIQ